MTIQLQDGTELPTTLLLGQHFVPGTPFTWEWEKVPAPSGAQVHILTVQTVAGTFGLVLEDDGLDMFIKSAQDARSPLSVVNASGLLKP